MDQKLTVEQRFNSFFTTVQHLHHHRCNPKLPVHPLLHLSLIGELEPEIHGLLTLGRTSPNFLDGS